MADFLILPVKMEGENIIVETRKNYGSIATQTESMSISPVRQRARGKSFPQYVAAISATLGALALGIVLGWLTPAAISAGVAFGLPVDRAAIGWIGSLVFLGAAVIFGPISCLIDWIGRKWTLLGLLIPYTIGWILIVLAKSLTAIYIGRFITGLACGGFCVVSPLYIAEIAEKQIRGALVSMFQLMTTVGILFVYTLSDFTPLITLSAICAGLPLIFGLVFLFQPESPIYLVHKNRMDEARKALFYLRGKNYNVDEEIQEIVADDENYQRNRVGLYRILKKRATRRAFLIGTGVMVFQQLSGLYSVMSYSYVIFQSSGIPLSTSVVFTLLGVVQLLGVLIGEAVADKKGRVYLLSNSAFYMALCLLITGVYLTLKRVFPTAINLTYGIIPFLALSGFALAFQVGFGPIPWVVISEIFPQEIKNRGVAFTVIVNFLVTFLISKYFLEIINLVGLDLTFYIFAIISVLALFFVRVTMIETKAKSFSEIENELEHGD